MAFGNLFLAALTQQEGSFLAVVEAASRLLGVRGRVLQSAFAEYGQSGCAGKRATPDVSLDADPASGVSVYDTVRFQGQSGWFTVGGTSASSPMWAARAAVAGIVIDAAACTRRGDTATSPSATTARRASSATTSAPAAGAGPASRHSSKRAVNSTARAERVGPGRDRPAARYALLQQRTVVADVVVEVALRVLERDRDDPHRAIHRFHA